MLTMKEAKKLVENQYAFTLGKYRTAFTTTHFVQLINVTPPISYKVKERTWNYLKNLTAK